MAGRGRKGKEQQPTGDTQEIGETGLEERSLLEIFISNQAKRDQEAEERRVQDKRDMLEAEVRAEARRVAAEIASEEREEKRRERAKIAEEERMEARALLKEKRKREELMRQEAVVIEREEKARLAVERAAARRDEVDREKEESARKAAERAAALQEEAAERAFNQQKEANELQAERSRQAAETLRLESQKVRTKDRAVASITAWQRSEDLEEFLLASERKLRAGDIPDGEWLGIMASKLTGEVGASWQEKCLTTDVYLEVRAAVLMGCGYTQKAAGEAFHAFRFENLKGLSADQLYRKGVQLVRRMIAPTELDQGAEFRLVRPWVYSCIGRKARASLEARVVESGDDLVRGLQDYLALEGDKLSGKVAVFGSEGSGSRRPTYGVGSGAPEGRKERVAGSNGGSGFKCFKCGKAGHKAADCWQGERNPGAKSVEGGSKIVCYICGVEGHKATTCPGKNGTQKGSKSVKQLRQRGTGDSVLKGKLNGKSANLLLDSGADITVVSESRVPKSARTGRSISVQAYKSKETIRMPTATVKFSVEGLADWEEVVALAPAEPGEEDEVLYGLRLMTPRGLDLVLLVNGLESAHVRRVTTRAEAKSKAAEKQEEDRVVGVEKPKTKPVQAEPVKVSVGKPRLRGKEAAEAVTGAVKRARNERVGGAGRKPSPTVQKAPVQALGKRPVAGGAEAAVAAGPSVQQKPKSFAEVVRTDKTPGTGEGGPTADRPVRNPEPVASDESESEEEDCPELDSLDEVSVSSDFEISSSEVEVVTEDQDEIEESVEYCLRKGGRVDDLRVPPVKEGSSSRKSLMKEVMHDPTLEKYRALALAGEQGFQWKGGLLYQARMDDCEEVTHVLVLPKGVRKRVMDMAHEGSGHLGARKVKALLRHRFVWPSMGVDIIAHCRSCVVCQRCAKAKSRRAPLMEREVLAEPFEVMAFDLVGPFPKAKNGYRFVLTAVCMGSKWPEAIPLKAQTARAVANGMLEIFARTGIPLQLLTDQGSQFIGSLVKHLCEDLRIDQVKTAPYHPECNGVVERMHGTLVPMLTKASQLGWSSCLSRCSRCGARLTGTRDLARTSWCTGTVSEPRSTSFTRVGLRRSSGSLR